MAYSAKVIANYFIGKSITDPKAALTPIKLIKLVYIAHGFYLVFKDNPLINEPIEAWRYGPVVASLYQEFKEYGNTPITQLAEIEKEIPPEDQYTLQFLNNVWNKYGDIDGLQLSTWTHEKYSPWYAVWEEKKGKLTKNHPINNTLIKTYFSTLLKPMDKQKKAA